VSRIWILARKDFLETRRDRLAFLFIFVMPIAFTAFFGLMFGGGSDRLPLAVWSGDAGPAAKQLLNAVESSDVVVVHRMTRMDAEQAVADSKAAAALEIPAGFSDAVSAGKPGTVTVVGVTGSTGAQTAQTEITALAGQVVAGEQAAQAAVDAAGSSALQQGQASAAQLREAALLMARPLASQALAHPAATIRVVQAGAAAGQVPSGFVLSSPGMLINFILFSLMTAGIALVQERKNFTLERLMTTHVRRWELIAGKVAGMFVLTFVQQIILIAVGQFLFGVDYLRDPAALLLMMIALSCVASTLGLLLAALLKSEQALPWCSPPWPWRPSPAPGSRWRSPARPSSSSGTCCPRRGSWTACAASSCAASGWPTCCPLSASPWPGRWCCSPSPSGASVSPIDHRRRVNEGGAGGSPLTGRRSLLAGLDARVLGQGQTGLHLDGFDDPGRHGARRVLQVLGGEAQGLGTLAAVHDLGERVHLGEVFGETLHVAALGLELEADDAAVLHRPHRGAEPADAAVDLG
jgi:ABC-2 type transport system permease protein